MTQRPIQNDLAELAAAYAVGALGAEDARQFEDKLLAGDAESLAAWNAVRPVMEAMTRSGSRVEPRLITRSRLINSLGLSKPAPSFSKGVRLEDPFAERPEAMVLLRADQVDWKETDVPGVQARTLWVDHENKRTSVLLRLAPGVVYPDHDHPGIEECLVLDGDLELGGKVMGKYDYMRIPKGGQHGTPRTRNGCLLLVTSPITEAA